MSGMFDPHQEFEPPPQRPRRSRGIDLTSTRLRVALSLLLLGLVIVIILVALSCRREPETTLPGDTNPRNVVATAALATFTPGPSPTALPTLTVAPEPTATPSVPNTVGIGVTVEVFNTDGLGLNMREGPGVSFAIVELLPEGTRLVIIGGPEEVDGFVWWKVQKVDSQVQGWVAEDFIKPVMP